MSKSIAELQNAFQNVVKILKRNKKVLAIFTFGSIVTGDVWEESDIDLFVVYKDQYNEIRDVFSESEDVPVHAKILCKKTFMELYNNDGKRGFIRNLLIKSKLVYSKDEEIIDAFNKARYSMDAHLDKWNLVYLGNIIKDLGVSKKYLRNGGINTSYEVLIRVLDSLSKLFINLNGYASTKDSLAMVINLDENIRKVANNLFNSEINKELLENTIVFIDKFIDENIVNSSNLLLEYLYEKGEAVSAYEISNDALFKDFNINVEPILKELAKRSLIVKDKTMLKDKLGDKIINECVYIAKVRNE